MSRVTTRSTKRVASRPVIRYLKSGEISINAYAIRDSLSVAGRYPADLSYDGLKAQLGKLHGLGAENILVGTGSTEILKVCDDLFLQDRPHLVAAETTYDAVYQYAVNSRADV